MSGRTLSRSTRRAAARVTLRLVVLLAAVAAVAAGLAYWLRGRAMSPAADEAPAAATGRKIKYWWDPMYDPPYISDKPGKSPMGMDLIPVYEDEAGADETGIRIDPVVAQNMGLRTVKAEEGSVRRTVRAAGSFRVAETALHDVALKVGGFVERLHADVEGERVEKGAPLLELYSPELVVAQEELLVAVRALARLGGDADPAVRRDAEKLLEDARAKLRLWDVAPEDIDAIAREGKARRTIAFRSPVAGHVVERNVVPGTSVQPGERLLRVADLSTLWLDARLFESDLPLVRLGQEAVARTQAFPGKEFRGEVIFLHPQVDPQTRTGTARAAFPNPELALRPGMYAAVEIPVAVAERALIVPREAVLDTGTRQIVFVAREQGRFEPREVSTGVEDENGMVQVLSGLAAGDEVVASGQFLLDAESRTREAIRKMREMPTAARGDDKPGAAMDGHAAAGASTEPSAGAAAAAGPLDAVLRAYFEMARALTEDRTTKADAVVAAVKAIPAEGDVGAAAKTVAGAAESFQPKAPLPEQRKQFKSLSEAVIRLVDASPAKARARSLYVVHCSMVNADWLQAEEKVANPYYGRTMLRCGEITRVIGRG